MLYDIKFLVHFSNRVIHISLSYEILEWLFVVIVVEGFFLFSYCTFNASASNRQPKACTLA
jgi:hypothetical protein